MEDDVTDSVHTYHFLEVAMSVWGRSRGWRRIWRGRRRLVKSKVRLCPTCRYFLRTERTLYDYIRKGEVVRANVRILIFCRKLLHGHAGRKECQWYKPEEVESPRELNVWKWITSKDQKDSLLDLFASNVSGNTRRRRAKRPLRRRLRSFMPVVLRYGTTHNGRL